MTFADRMAADVFLFRRGVEEGRLEQQAEVDRLRTLLADVWEDGYSSGLADAMDPAPERTPNPHGDGPV